MHFHLKTEVFELYSLLKMANDSLWIDVSGLLKAGRLGLGQIVAKLTLDTANTEKLPLYG